MIEDRFEQGSEPPREPVTRWQKTRCSVEIDNGRIGQSFAPSQPGDRRKAGKIRLELLHLTQRSSSNDLAVIGCHKTSQDIFR